jgi:hypothetical protein
MTERWRRELGRLSQLRPADDLLRRARLGPTSALPEPRRASPVLAIVLALAVFAAGGALAWRAFVPGSTGPVQVWRPGYPSAPDSGYYVLVPDQAERVDDSDARVTALTNLPEGTLLDISTTNEGTCCLPVEDSRIIFTTQDSACYEVVGQPPNGTTFDVTITAKPDFEPWILPGAIGGDPEPPQQPDSVLRVLGSGFENLSGDQVRGQDDGSKWLVSSGNVPWPQPRCGGDPIPLFGGPECLPDEYQQQLQGDDLAQAMGEVMGEISQGRMCEFWSVMLPPEVEAQHPWPELSAEWRAWLLEQDFSDAEPTSDWSTGPLHWEPAGGEGGTSTVNVIHKGERIATLEVRPLPDYCPSCDTNVVPFWGLISWQLYPPAESSDVAPPTPATDWFQACPDPSGALVVATADVDEARATAERYLWGPDAAAVVDPAGAGNGLKPGSGTGDEEFYAARPAVGDVLVPPACGTDVATATYAVTFDDGTDSASADFTLYAFKRSAVGACGVGTSLGKLTGTFSRGSA